MPEQLEIYNFNNGLYNDMYIIHGKSLKTIQKPINLNIFSCVRQLLNL